MKFNSKVKFTLSEAEHQEKIFNWAKYVPELKWMFAIPNGGYRRPLEALRFVYVEKKLDFLSDMEKEGYQCKVCYGSDEAIANILNYIKLR